MSESSVAARNPATATLQVQDYFTPRLVDMAAEDSAFAGILTPQEELGAEKFGITDQFLADGAEYHRKYSNAAYFLHLFRKGLSRTPAPATEPLTILDIGTGPGVNTIQPCLTLFPGCRIVATDLSPQLLGILRSYVLSEGLQDRVAAVCTDAMKNHFKAGAFDMVVGSAILHHLMDPAELLKTARRALKPGGIAIFFEPFEGYVFLRVAYETILKRAEREGLPLHPEVARVFRALCADFKFRLGRNKTDPHYANVDDKWLFTRNYFAEKAAEAGFSGVEIASVHDMDRYLFKSLTLSMLSMAAGLTEANVDPWAWEHIDLLDECVSHDLKQDLIFEGVVVFRA